MVLCFTKYLLDERHQLSKIWLAAHYEKKMKRNQVFEVDIVKSVQEILSAEIFFDLRISGHLLFGIVKIHSKKVKYLLTECNDIFYQVKLFRAGIIDLPDNLKTARLNDITLPEFFDNFENVQANVIDSILSLNQSLVEDITLKETDEKLTLLDEMDMMEFTFHEEDRPINFEDFINFEKEMIFFKNSDKSKSLDKATEINVHNVSENKRKLNEINKGQEDSMQQGYNFQNETSEISDSINIYPAVNDLQFQIVPDQTDLHLVNDKIIHGQCQNLDSSPLQLNQEQTEDLYLDPVKISTTHISKNKISKKRKLTIDYIKALSYDVIKKQILDTSDITSVLELAPASRRLMVLKKIGSAEQLLCLPALKIYNTNISHLYKRHLKTCKESNFNEKEYLENLHKLRKRSKTESLLEITENIELNENIELDKSHLQNKSVAENFENDSPSVDTFTIEIEDTSMPINGFTQRHNLSLPKKNILYNLAGNAKDDQNSQVSKISDERWEYALQGKIIQMLQNLKFLFETKPIIKFSETLKNKRKFQVSQKFLCLLILKKFQVISLLQQETYGEIFISPATNYNSACSEFG